MTIRDAVAVIPARGGSKRIPRKNVRAFNGRPLIQWTIESVLASKCFSRVIVSTDDSSIAQIARAAGAEVPFSRPPDLSDDFTGTLPVIQHAITAAQLDRAAGFLCCVYPGSVLSTPNDYACAFNLLHNPQMARYVVPVVPYPHPIQRAIGIDESGLMQYLDPAHAMTRTQDLEVFWHDAGQFYWGDMDAWRQGLPVIPNARPYRMNAHGVVDIDDLSDWDRAQAIHAALHSR